jgi:hypothetical protein
MRGMILRIMKDGKITKKREVICQCFCVVA